MADPPTSSVSFGFARTKVVQKKVAINVQEDGPEKVLLSAVETGGVFRTVDGLDASRVGLPGKKTYIIPKIDNTYKAGKANGAGAKFTPSFVPPASDAPVAGQGGDKFELAAPVAAAITEYGLTQVTRKAPAEGEGEGSRLGGSITQRLTAERRSDDTAYQQDVQELPDMAPVEAYEAMPIEEFGMAMMRGMGWTEGMGVGRNRKVVEAIEYLKRPERLGLGAQAVLEAAKPKRQRKMGDAPEVRREEMVLAPDADGRQRNVRKLDEKLVHREVLQPGPRPGKEMAVVAGRHEGLRCVVVEVLPVREGRSERCRVKLKPSDEEAEVRTSDLGELSDALLRRRQPETQREGQREQEASREARRAAGGSGRRDTDDRTDRDGKGSRRSEPPADTRRSGEREVADDGRSGEGRGQQERGLPALHGSRRSESEPEDDVPAADQRPWLFPHLKVRVIDKHVKRGKMYLKKGNIVDVHPGGLADVSMDESGEVLQLRQSSLETVIPKSEGAALLVVAGRLRGSKARLLQSNTSEGVAAVQLASDFSIHRLLLDDVCQYVGSLEEDDEM